MILVYMVILCLTAFLGAWAGVRVMRRLAPMIGVAPGIGWCMFLPALGLLIVAGAPAPVLVAATGLALWLRWRAARPDGIVALVLAVTAAILIGLTGLTPATAPYLSTVPPLAALAMAGMTWWVLALASWGMGHRTAMVAGGSLAALAALAMAPLMVPAASALTLDAAILASAVAGVVLAGGRYYPSTLPPRMGLGLLIGYLQIAAIWQGAWVAAATSSAVWLLAAGWAWMQQDGVTHA